MLSSKKSSQRFTLLLLEENESYVGNWVAQCHWPLSSESTFQKANKLAGTLRLCSKSLFFEPDDVRLPIARYVGVRPLLLDMLHSVNSPLKSSSLPSPLQSATKSLLRNSLF